jgi:hypothetical protein
VDGEEVEKRSAERLWDRRRRRAGKPGKGKAKKAGKRAEKMDVDGEEIVGSVPVRSKKAGHGQWVSEGHLVEASGLLEPGTSEDDQ